ncbi:MAG: hypothetical protein A3F78_01820 [Burkholderiales bacterium RIFCSPLOWO2_12_FULL_61_40]|nr:MAG: hypothetical protein A3F78_01820 [Burkholderiales bacterium RIFCSPLOWO2_12_FULL_61_40]
MAELVLTPLELIDRIAALEPPPRTHRHRYLGVLYLWLRSLQTQPLSGETFSLLPDEQRRGDSLHQMLERLGARLGPQQVLCVRPQAGHRPERMQQWRPWSAAEGITFATKKGAACAMNTGDGGLKHHEFSDDLALYPSWLLAAPLRLLVQAGCPQYQGPLTLLAGPQRVESGWLEDGAACATTLWRAACKPGWCGFTATGWAGQGSQGGGWCLHGLFA